MDIQTRSEWRKYAEASFLGAVRGVAGLPFEHPFDFVKTYWQANPHMKSSIEVTKKIYREKGVKGFYTGVIPNGTRLVIKESYRWPLMIHLPRFYRWLIPSQIVEKIPSLEKGLTGASIATLETFIISPLEEIKVWSMTRTEGSKNVIEFFRQHKGELTKNLFRGLNAVYARQILSWVSFLVADDSLKKTIRFRSGKSQLTLTDLLIVSVGVGAINTAIIMPFDSAKTHLQKDHPLVNLGLNKTFRTIIDQSGWRGLYIGWRVKLWQYIIRSIPSVGLMDKLDRAQQ